MGVKACYLLFLDGNAKYGDNQEDFFMRMAVDPDNFAKVRTDWRVSDEDLAAFQADERMVRLLLPPWHSRKGWENGQKGDSRMRFF